MGAKLGLNAVLHYKPSGSYVAITNVTDVTLTMDKAEADVTTRAGNGWKLTIDSLKDATVEWEMIWDTTDTALAAFMSAFLNNTQVQMAVMDGAYATTGSQGLVALMTVTKFERKEPLTEAMKVAIAVKPAYSATAPAWYTAP